MTTIQRLTLTGLHSAAADRLTSELDAAGWDSSSRPIRELRRDVARLLHGMYGPYYLCDKDNDVIREATEDETVASVLAGAEGWIDVDGQRCYVSE